MGVVVREKDPGSGEWWVFINHQSFRRSKMIGRDKRLAREVAEKIKARLVLGDVSIAKRPRRLPTFKECADLWFVLPHDWKESTRELYDLYCRKHILPRLGGLRVDEIRRKDLKGLFDGLLSDGMARSTLAGIRAVISGVLEHAVDSELIEVSPLASLKIKTANKKALGVDPLTEEEAYGLLEEAKTYWKGRYYPPLLCALRTGMRIGEIQALQWRDIDFSGRFIEVRRGLRYSRLTDTKNKERRRVDMSPHLTEALKALRITQKKRALRHGRAVSDFVFASRTGNPLCRQTFRNFFTKCLERAGLRGIRVHDLRHSYATIRLMKGHNLLDVSYQLGHSNVKITQDTYCHWIPGKFKNEVDELDQMHPSAPQAHPGKSEISKVL